MSATEQQPSVAEVLLLAADLLEKPGAWTQGANARNQRGYPTPSRSDDAVCFCMAGAILRVGDGDYSAADIVRTILPSPKHPTKDWLVAFNDDPSRTQAEVVTALRQAAALTPRPIGEGK